MTLTNEYNNYETSGVYTLTKKYNYYCAVKLDENYYNDYTLKISKLFSATKFILFDSIQN
jgi:hypothetical protein